MTVQETREPAVQVVRAPNDPSLVPPSNMDVAVYNPKTDPNRGKRKPVDVTGANIGVVLQSAGELREGLEARDLLIVALQEEIAQLQDEGMRMRVCLCVCVIFS
jgi:hypothetical protein